MCVVTMIAWQKFEIGVCVCVPEYVHRCYNIRFLSQSSKFLFLRGRSYQVLVSVMQLITSKEISLPPSNCHLISSGVWSWGSHLLIILSSTSFDYLRSNPMMMKITRCIYFHLKACSKPSNLTSKSARVTRSHHLKQKSTWNTANQFKRRLIIYIVYTMLTHVK